MGAQINDGGAAFPQADSHAASELAQVAIAGMTRGDERDATYLRVKAEALRGMTLRDWFAGTMPDPFAAVNSPGTAASMSGLECPSLTADQAEWARFWIEAEAKVRYMKADAMLKAREVKP